MYSSNPKIKNNDQSWKATRFELFGGVGACGFLGDLGGQDGEGQPFIYDYEPTTTRYSISAGGRYYLRQYHAIRGTLSYARVRGSDALTEYPNRKYRNLNFKSPIIELGAMYEFHILRPNYIHFAGSKNTKLIKGNRFGAYLSGGVGAFFFNPRGQRDGEYYSLQPLRTEGQGFPDGPDPYRRFALSFPIGGGAYMLLNHNFVIGVDISYRWTTSDYIDDASGFYYDNQAIAQRDGADAAYFANPSVALDDVPNPDWYTQNQPRGGSESNDSYIFAQITLSKPLGPSVSRKRFKQKKRRKGKSYKRGKKKNFNKKRKFKAPKLDFGKRRKKRRKNITTF